jgi:hypothetical protein
VGNKELCAIAMWEMVVMDGSSAVLKMALNSKMSQDIPHEDWLLGMMILMESEEYKFVFIQDKEECMCTGGVLLIENCDWSLSHDTQESDSENDCLSTLTPNLVKVIFDKATMDRVERDSVILFTKSMECEDRGLLGFGVASQSVLSHGWFSHEPHQGSSLA